MLKISDRAKNVSPSLTLAISTQANKMKSEGVDVVSFAVGEPDFNTPDYIIDAAKVALDKGMTKYTPVPGTKEFREQICKKFKDDNGLDYVADQIIVSTGGKQSLYNVFQTIVQEGDEVILLAPYWLSYPEMVKFCGGKVVSVDLADDDFNLNIEKIEKAITDKTRAILINTPNNPTGVVYNKDQLSKLAEMLKKYPDIWVISDEIYEKLVYDGKQHFSIAAYDQDMYNRTFVVNGMSKSYAMTGWRIGYVACPSVQIAKAVSGLQSHQTSNTNSIAQYAACVALKGGKEFIDDMQKTFDGRRKLIIDLFKNAKDVSIVTPSGAFYLMLNVSKLFGRSYKGNKISSAFDFADLLIKYAYVATVPCEGFGAPLFVRLSYATSEAQIKKGVERIIDFISQID